MARYAVQVAVAAVAVAAAALLIGPKALGWHGVIVLTGSMTPALETGGVAFVDPVEPEDIGVGDIMTFTRPDSDQQVTHRVIEVIGSSSGPRFRTKGDANDVADGWVVDSRQVVGKVRFALPHLGGFVDLLVGNRRALGLAMAVPALYLVTDDIRRSRAKRRQKERRDGAPPAPVPAPVPEPLVVPVATRPRRTRAVPPGGAPAPPATRRPRPLRPEPMAAAPSPRAHRRRRQASVARDDGRRLRSHPPDAPNARRRRHHTVTALGERCPVADDPWSPLGTRVRGRLGR